MAPVASVVVTPDSATVLARSTLQLQATLLDSAGRLLTGRGVHWTSSDPFVATVSSTGLVTGVGNGPAIITATAEQRSGAARLTVFAPVASVTVDQGDQTIVVGGAVQLSATPRDWRGVVLAARVVAWSSLDPGTVSVTSTGVVTGQAPGSGVLTATSEGQTGSATIAVAILELRELAPGLSTHTCGVTPGGATFCWGSDAYGQLGNGAAGDDATAMLTRGDHSFVTASGGGRFTCGVVAGGAAYCWGSGSRGRLGNGSVTGSPTPVAVAGGLSFRTLSAGFSHTCALTDEGAAYCWGDNGTGQLGTETVKLSLTPRKRRTFAERASPPRAGCATVQRAQIGRPPQLRRDSRGRCVLLGRQSLGRAGRRLDASLLDARACRGRAGLQRHQRWLGFHLRGHDRRPRVLLGGRQRRSTRHYPSP